MHLKARDGDHRTGFTDEMCMTITWDLSRSPNFCLFVDHKVQSRWGKLGCIHYSPSSALMLCVHTRYNLFAHPSCTSQFILIFIKSTVDCIAHFTPYFILPIFTYIYIYSLVLCFIFYFIFLHCPLSGPVLTYISLLIIPCMIVYVTNKQEPWTLPVLFTVRGMLRCDWLSGFIAFCRDWCLSRFGTKLFIFYIYICVN